eukprot:ANDGO_05032.mRNA.1 hypothetical protein
MSESIVQSLKRLFSMNRALRSVERVNSELDSKIAMQKSRRQALDAQAQSVKEAAVAKTADTIENVAAEEKRIHDKLQKTDFFP